MAKMDIVTKPGESRILIAKPEGFEWGTGEIAPHFDHHIIDTDATPQALRDHHKIENKKLVLMPEEEWHDVKRDNEGRFHKLVTDVLSGKYDTLEGIELAIAEARARLEAELETL